MKRFLAATAVTVCLGASAVYAHSAMTIRPTDMKDGETKVLTDDDRKITIKRDGDKLHVEIDKAGKTDKLTIIRDGESVRIERADGTHTFVDGSDSDDVRRKIIIDGVPLDLDHPRFRAFPRDGAGDMQFRFRERADGDERSPRFDRRPRGEGLPRHGASSWFVCPKDKTLLRVPEAAEEKKEYKCPVDGTVMEQRRTRAFYFLNQDDDDQ